MAGPEVRYTATTMRNMYAKVLEVPRLTFVAKRPRRKPKSIALVGLSRL